MTDDAGDRVVFDRENAQVFPRGNMIIIIWPQPDGPALTERRTFPNRAARRKGKPFTSEWSRDSARLVGDLARILEDEAGERP